MICPLTCVLVALLPKALVKEMVFHSISTKRWRPVQFDIIDSCEFPSDREIYLSDNDVNESMAPSCPSWKLANRHSSAASDVTVRASRSPVRVVDNSLCLCNLLLQLRVVWTTCYTAFAFAANEWTKSNLKRTIELTLATTPPVAVMPHTIGQSAGLVTMTSLDTERSANIMRRMGEWDP